MPTLQELRSQIADLEKQAAEMHAHESRTAIVTVVELVRKYGLTAEQIGLAPMKPPVARGRVPRPAKTSGRPGAGIPKFADPATGKTWTGFGKPPSWLAGAKDRDAFRLDPVTPGAKSVRKRAAKKAGGKGPKSG